MKPIVTETTNVTFVGDGCEDLPGTKYICEDEVTPGIEVAIELDAEDKKQIMETGMIYLNIMGRTVQPFYISTESVFENGKEDEK
ncbi:hypothetical protein ACFO0S_09725 [Chryseomicrobium palamuruense]|uniref:Uncharacterized protein n=1 Tax=Chryseomicrobium palamuruense TaxID=682973 RepID=A0ABV8UVJ3_9BACL